MIRNRNDFEKYFVKQHNQSWCGLACLSMLCKYYGGDFSQEKLVKISGTNVSGTTLLGLYQAANSLGLKAEGYEGNCEELGKLQNPAILHLTLENGIQHYVIFLGMDGRELTIADPADKIVNITADKLNSIWKTKALLSITRTENFKEIKDINTAKYDWLKSLLKPDIRILSVILLLSLVFSVLSICMALFSQKLVDDILPSKDFNRLIMGTAILAVLLFAKNLFGYIRMNLAARQVQDFSNRIVNRFYSIVLHLPKVFFDSLKTGEVTARLNDASRIQRTINYISGTFIIDIMTIAVVTIFLVVYWWPTAVLTIVASAVFALIFFKNAKKILEGQRAVMVNYAQSESFFFDSVQGIDVIKSYGKEGTFSNSAKGIFSIFQGAVFNLTILSNKIGLWTQNIAVTLVITIISVCSYGVLNGHITLGELMAIMAFSSMVLGSVTSVMGAYFTYQEAKVAYNRLYEFVEIPDDAAQLNGEGKEWTEMEVFHSLLVRDLCFRYIGRPLVLKDVGFRANKGEILAITGEIGCGKSTLLNLLLRFYIPESGNIIVNDKSCEEYPVEQWRRQIAIMPQQIKLFNATLIENICMETTPQNMESAIALCSRYGLDHYFLSLPMAYLTRVGEDGVNLSGGQRQLVGLCRALFQNPQILLFDEPTNNMDRQSAELLWNIIEQEKHHRICVIVTHDQGIAGRADKVVRIG